MLKVPSKDKVKIKSLSLQKITTRANKKKMETRTDTAGNSGDHAVSDNNPGSSKHTVTKNLTEENRAKSTFNPNSPDLDNVIREGKNSFPSINLQESQGNINIASQNRGQDDLTLALAMYNQKLAAVKKLEEQEEQVRLRNEIKKLDIRLGQWSARYFESVNPKSQN